eukprot:gene2150-18200_t
MCTRAARYTIDLIFARGTDVSGVNALITGWVNSKLPPECPIEELDLEEGSIVSAIYYPTEDEVSAGMPVSCPEWALQAIAGLSTETRTDVVLADCLIPTPSHPKPPTLPPTPGGIVPGGISPGGISPGGITSNLTPIQPPAHDNNSAPLGAIIGGEIEVVQELNMQAGPSGLAAPAAFVCGPISCTSSRDISRRASCSISHTQVSQRNYQVEAIPQVGPRLDSLSSANLYSSSCPRPAAAWRKHASLDVSTVSSQNQDPMGSAYAPDRNIAMPPQQGLMVKLHAYPREPRESISEPYMTGVLSSLAATSTSKLGPSIHTPSRNNSRMALRSKSHTQIYMRGSQVQASTRVGSRLSISLPVKHPSSSGSTGALSAGTWKQRTSPPPQEAVSPPANHFSSSGSPRALSVGAWMQRTSLDRSTDCLKKQSPLESDYAQDCDLDTSPRQASTIEPDSYPGETGDLVFKRGSPYSTPGSVFSKPGRSVSTPGVPFSHLLDRGTEMGPVLPTQKSHKRPPNSFRSSSTSYLEVATQVADRAKSTRLSHRKSHSGIDKGKTDKLSRLSGSCYMPGERRAYNITSSGSTGYLVTAASSHSCFKRKPDIEAPEES